MPTVSLALMSKIPLFVMLNASPKSLAVSSRSVAPGAMEKGASVLPLWASSTVPALMMYRPAREQMKKATKGKEVLKFFNWAYANGGAMATELDYVAMPTSVIKLIQAEWKKQIKDGANKPIW